MAEGIVNVNVADNVNVNGSEGLAAFSTVDVVVDVDVDLDDLRAHPFSTDRVARASD